MMKKEMKGAIKIPDYIYSKITIKGLRSFPIPMYE